MVWIGLLSGRRAVFVEIFRGDVGPVGPEDGVLEAEADELTFVCQFLESRVLEQRGQVDALACPVVEGAEQGVVPQIFHISNGQYHN